METSRIGFRHWDEQDLPLAERLWGDPAVTRYICASGAFSSEEIAARLKLEIENQVQHGIQYWPIFEKGTGDLIGCCGFRPTRSEGVAELGFHLRPAFWGKGLATEAANAAIRYGFDSLGLRALEAGHNPKNTASKHCLEKLGFVYVQDVYYAPTGLMHPTFRMQHN